MLLMNYWSLLSLMLVALTASADAQVTVQSINDRLLAEAKGAATILQLFDINYFITTKTGTSSPTSQKVPRPKLVKSDIRRRSTTPSDTATVVTYGLANIKEDPAAFPAAGTSYDETLMAVNAAGDAYAQAAAACNSKTTPTTPLELRLINPVVGKWQLARQLADPQGILAGSFPPVDVFFAGYFEPAYFSKVLGKNVDTSQVLSLTYLFVFYTLDSKTGKYVLSDNDKNGQPDTALSVTVFNSNFRWGTAPKFLSSASRDTTACTIDRQAVTGHEFGHGLGFKIRYDAGVPTAPPSLMCERFGGGNDVIYGGNADDRFICDITSDPVNPVTGFAVIQIPQRIDIIDENGVCLYA